MFSTLSSSFSESDNTLNIETILTMGVVYIQVVPTLCQKIYTIFTSVKCHDKILNAQWRQRVFTWFNIILAWNFYLNILVRTD